MKTKSVIFILGVLLFSGGLAQANFASIDNAVVNPNSPLDIDIITLDISGSASSSSSHIVSSLFQQEGNQLVLDLTIDMGIITVPSYWSYSEQIGTLAPGGYTATIRLFYPYDPYGELQDTKITEFTVIPEPATFLLFGLAGLILRKRK